jgi:hypothetical protein
MLTMKFSDNLPSERKILHQKFWCVWDMEVSLYFKTRQEDIQVVKVTTISK